MDHLFDNYDITSDEFRDASTWEKLRIILRAHPNPITRHEACFIAGELHIADFISDLKDAVVTDPSLVVRHEAIEALGRMKGSDVPAIDAFLVDIMNDRKDNPYFNHSDIIATVEMARKRLAATLNASKKFN